MTSDSTTVITFPPRHGKSELASKTLPAWYLGNFPDRRVLLTSYEAEFASSFGRKARDILDRYGPALYGVSVRQDSKAAHRWEINHHGGEMYTAGAGGPITGRGANLIIVDDPIKNSEEALSATIRQKLWDWYTTVLMTRKEPGAAEIIIMTRWHSDDLVGRILADAKENGRPINHLRFPAIAEADDQLGREPGEALWPERYPIDKLRQIEKTQGFWFSAMYQGRPVPMGGALFKAEWFEGKTFKWAGDPGPAADGYRLSDTGRFWPKTECPRFIMIDPSLGKKDTGDPVAMGCYAITPDDRLLTLRKQSKIIHFERLIETLADWCEVWNPDFVGMESNGFQILLAREARNNRRIRCPVREIDPEGKSKLVRGIPAVESAHNGLVYFPAGEEEWSLPCIEEYCEWTGNEDDRDDRVDVLAYAVKELLTYRHRGNDEDAVPVAGRGRGWR